uniref:Uncharacterized protein n=1 Tax=Coccolithus braarudii TaxID=221442 RepID=A0A7S0L3A4_9EUKA
MPADLGSLGGLVDAKLGHNRLSSPLPPGLGRLGRLKDLDISGNAAIVEVPEDLLRDTTLQHLKVDPALLGSDGMLKEMPGSDAYLVRRKARIDKELHSKATGGDVDFKT